jgi:hypothetical protein
MALGICAIAQPGMKGTLISLMDAGVSWYLCFAEHFYLQFIYTSLECLDTYKDENMIFYMHSRVTQVS